MSEFIIASNSNQDRFIQYDKLGKMCVTNRQENAARFPDSGKAWRIINTQMSKKMRDGWHVIAYENKQAKKQDLSKRFKADIDTSSVLITPLNWEEINRSLSEIFTSIIIYREKLTSELNQIEAELCDCEHACEFFKYNAANGYKLYAMIHERRNKRRFLKDELKKATSLLNMSYSDIANGEINNIISEINNQTYAPRSLKYLFEENVSKKTI